MQNGKNSGKTRKLRGAKRRNLAVIAPPSPFEINTENLPLSQNVTLAGIHILDGGLASELEYQGARIDTPLWSAQVL